LSKVPEDDKDYRTIVLETADMVPQELLNQATRSLRATQVRTIKKAPATTGSISDQDMTDMQKQA
jgi:hypothetical protein